MILYYYGNDTFRSSQEVIELKDRYLKQAKNHINLITLDMEVADFDDLLKELKSLPLFPRRAFSSFGMPFSAYPPLSMNSSSLHCRTKRRIKISLLFFMNVENAKVIPWQNI